MAVNIVDKRHSARKPEEVTEVEKPKSLVRIHPETLAKAQSEAVRSWLFSVMPDQSAEGQSA
jgi:hypothetical protein